MIISMKCHKARKNYICDNCKKGIKKGEEYYRLFGAAYKGDKPYEIIKCCNCMSEAAENYDDGEIRRKLKLIKGRNL